jgi:acyl dehydratase
VSPVEPNLEALDKEGPARVRSWTSTDALLYAIGVGAGAVDPAEELAFTTENSKGITQQMLPTFAVIVGMDLGNTAELVPGGLNMANLVHGEQSIELLRPLPVEGNVTVTGKITGVWDKGSGMVIDNEATGRDVDTGEVVFVTRNASFIRGAGGWGGDRGPSGPKNVPPDRAPDHVVTYQTRPDQALLYRLSGDRNPLHSDPSFATMAGFPKPILHGLCTYGFTGRALLHSLCGSDPARFRRMDARFARPVMPGDRLTVKIWATGAGEAIYTTEDQNGEIKISEGLCRFD